MHGDIVKEPFEFLESRFREDMHSLENNLRFLDEVGSDGLIMRECVDKVTACMDDLSGQQAADLAAAILQMIYIVSARCNEIKILQNFVTDPKYVNPQALADFLLSPAHWSSCNLGEYLIPFVKHLIPPEKLP